MKIFLYSSTHWDREWYECFQGFRHRLVEMADELVEGLETEKDFGVFHFDGQTIVLEDILEIAPDLEERFAKLIQSGKLAIGPWYCMPDEVNISGESLIRNLQIGREIAHKWGAEPMGDGYICDIFGHIAQMPQIFAGMGLHHTVLGRGTNMHKQPMHFLWQAPDGTDVCVFKLHDWGGYGDFSHFICNFANDPELDDPSVETIMIKIKEYCDERVNMANIPVVMFMDGNDHNHLNKITPRYIEALKRLYPDAEVYHVNVENMCREVEKYRDQLPVFQGELLETTKHLIGYDHLITNTLSSRYPLKLANDRLETRLEKIVQPLYAYGKSRSRDGFLKLAQKYLIQNHPHDSICGCSIDQVHRDMVYRFDQSRLILDEIMKRVSNAMADGSFDAPVAYAEDSHEAKILRIYNPLPYRTHRMVECKVTFEKDWKKYFEPFGYENICSFKLFDKDGKELPYGISDIYVGPEKDFYTICFEADLIASGVTDIEIRPWEKPSRYLERLTSGATFAENEDIIVSINPSGSISITDKHTGTTYPDLLGIIDDGEIGDGWFHCNPAVDRTVTNTYATIEKCANNINGVTFRITQMLHLPEEMDRSHFGIRRSEKYVEVPVTHYVTVYRNEKYVTVKTIVDNKACDHRMKLRLATGITGDRYYSGQAFAFVERKTGIDMDTADWKETASLEKATNGMIVKRGNNCGFAFIAKHGLHECAVTEDGHIDITLLRCYRKTVGTDGEPDGQLIGTHEFEYTLLPLSDEDTLADIARVGDQLKTDIVAVTTTGKTGASYAEGLAVESDTFLFSTANKLEDGMEFRIYNCADTDGTGVITLPKSAQTAALTEMDGRFISHLPVTDEKISLTLGKWKIATIKVTF